MNLKSVDELEQQSAGFDTPLSRLRKMFDHPHVPDKLDETDCIYKKLHEYFLYRGLDAWIYPLDNEREVLCIDGWFEAYIVIPSEIENVGQFCLWATNQADKILRRGRQGNDNCYRIGF